MKQIRKFYRDEVTKLQRKIRRREKWPGSDEANKTDTVSGYNRYIVKCDIFLLKVKCDIFLLKQDLAETERLLKRYGKA